MKLMRSSLLLRLTRLMLTLDPHIQVSSLRFLLKREIPLRLEAISSRLILLRKGHLSLLKNLLPKKRSLLPSRKLLNKMLPRKKKLQRKKPPPLNKILLLLQQLRNQQPKREKLPLKFWVHVPKLVFK